MLTEHILPQTITNPSSGTITADIQGDLPFEAQALNFAYDYYTTDQRLRLTLSAVQESDDGKGARVTRGLEMVFDSDIVEGTYPIASKKVYATFWKMSAKNGETHFQTFDADTGSFSLTFDHRTETYNGRFSFKSTGPDAASADISQGLFSIKGRDNFTL